MTLKHVRDCLENGDIKGAISALDGYELRMHHARSKGGSVKSPAKVEAAKRRWEARQGRGSESVPVYKEGEPIAQEDLDRITGDKPRHNWSQFNRPVFEAEGHGKPVKITLPPGVMKGSEMEGRGHE